MYTEKVIEHFKNPHNQGSIKDANATAIQTSPSCGDTMKLYLNIEDNVIKEVKFETMGCAAAIASSSAFTDMVKGKTIEEALAITKKQLVEDLGGLPAPKVHCSLLSVDALHKAIKNYKENK